MSIGKNEKRNNLFNVLSVILSCLLAIVLFWSLKKQYYYSNYISSEKVVITSSPPPNKLDSVINVKVRVFFIQDKHNSFTYRYTGKNLTKFQNYFYFNNIGINLVCKTDKYIIDNELSYFNDNSMPAFTFITRSKKYYKKGYITILIKKPDVDLVVLDENREIVEDIKDNSDLLGVGFDKVVIMNDDNFSKTTLLHEICHSVGMLHVKDELNVMYPYDNNKGIYLSRGQLMKLRKNLKNL